MTEFHKQAFTWFFESTNLAVKICNSTGQPLFSCPFSDEPEGPDDFNRILIQNYREQTQGKRFPVVKLAAELFFFAVFQVHADEFLIIGPAASLRFDNNHLVWLAIEQKIYENRFKIFCDNILATPILSYRRFLSGVAIAIFLANGTLINMDEVILTREAANIQEHERNLTSKLFYLREQQIPTHTPYDFEQGILLAVSEGSEAKLRQRLDIPVRGEIGQMGFNEIQQQKYTFVTFTALVTRAAIKGGLDPEVAFSMSDVFIQGIEKLQSHDQFLSLTYHMVLQFTRKVAEIKGLTKLSPTIRACIEYINCHLHEEIYIKDLASLAKLTPRVLARKFRQEMSCTIVEYIHMEKMKEAKSLLQYTDYSITDIGNYLQYNSQSYFTSVFKRYCQITPQQYRDKLKNSTIQ